MIAGAGMSGFQGGPSLEIFSTQGKNPVELWKVPSVGIKKDFDKNLKGYVYLCEGNGYMQYPKDEKKSGDVMM